MPNIVSPKELQTHAATLAAWASAILLGLANGKYDKQVAITETVLEEIGVVFPPALDAEKALEVFLWLNKMSAPRAAIVPSPQGGFVPFNNSRVMPDGSLRPYDPAIDGPGP